MGGCDRCIRMNLLCTRRRFNYDDHPTSNLCGEEASYSGRDEQPPSNLCGEAPSLLGQCEDVQPPSNLCGEAPLTLDSGEVDQPTSNTSGEATSDATPDSRTVLLQETPSSGYDSVNSLSDFSDVQPYVQYDDTFGTKFTADLLNHSGSALDLSDPNRPPGMFPCYDLQYTSTKVRGKAMVFAMHEPNRSVLEMTVHHRRIQHEDTDFMYWMECRTYPVTTMQNHCLGCTVAFRANSDLSWRFGVIDKIQYRLDVGNNSPVDCHVALWQWDIPEGYNPNSCARKGIPFIFLSQDWSSTSAHFQFCEFRLPQDCVELVWINQVLGPPHNGYRYDTINPLDGGVQSSPTGPDHFHPIPPQTPLLPIIRNYPVLLDKGIQDFFYIRDDKYVKKHTTKKQKKIEYGDEYINAFTYGKMLVLNKDVDVRYCFVQTHDGSVVPAETMREVSLSMRGMYTVPSLISATDGHPEVKFFLVSPQRFRTLCEKLNGSVYSSESFARDFDNEVEAVSIGSVSLICANEDKREGGNKFMPAFIFSGAGSPDTPQDQKWETGHLDFVHKRLQFNSFISKNGRYTESIPVSFVYMSAKTHKTQYDQYDMKLCELAAGSKSGTVQRRLLQGNNSGFLSYTGSRAANAVMMPSVHQGPGDLSKYQYTNDKCDPKYMPYMLKSLNYVFMNTAYTTKYFFRHLDCSAHIEKSHMWISTIGIRTVNFSCCSHCDEGDNHPEVQEEISQELKKVINCPNIPANYIRRATNALAFVNHFNNPTPTTCCYQLIRKSQRDIRSHYYFVMDGIYSCYRIFDKMTMTNCGGCFQHNTSVAVYTEDIGEGKTQIYLGEHPDLDWLAWGAGRNGGKKKSKKK